MLRVATHGGSFHADDVLAFAILKAATGGALELTRSREQADWDAAHVVFDVGGICDPAKGRFDHHMRDKPMRDDGAPYSSAGMVWKAYGERAITALLPGAEAGQLGRIWGKLDQGLVRDVDLMDNGATTPSPGHFATVIEAWNPSFAEPDGCEDTAFLAAAELAGAVLARLCARAHAAVIAIGQVELAARAAPDPRILVLDSNVPWEDAIFDLGLDQALFVIRPKGSNWTVSAVPPELGSFDQRLALPDAWGGLRDEAMAQASGVADATFCHPARFICGAKSRDGAIALALKAAG
jgi:uncharacterized UPF0160 family protein